MAEVRAGQRLTAGAEVSPAPIRFALLGAVRAWHGDAELDLGPPQQRAMLAYLLAEAGHPVTLGSLIEALWEDAPPASAANQLHRYVGALRRILEPELPPRAAGRWLLPHTRGYRLNVDAESLDLLLFRRCRTEARRAVADGQPQSAVTSFVTALQLWRGPCAADLPSAGQMHALFTSIDEERISAAHEAADAALRFGLAQQVLPEVRRAAAADRLAESLQARLMLLLAAAGRQAEALEVFQGAQTRLADELGIDPGAELRTAQRRVLRQETADETIGPTALAALHNAPLPTAPGLREPGPFPAGQTSPLRNAPPRNTPARNPPMLEAASAELPEQPTPQGYPSPAPIVRPAQIPADLPTFSGRRAELAEVLALRASAAAQHTVVIVAIDGMPGAGKSTLAVHWAHLLAEHFPDGQLHVNLRGFDGSASILTPAEALRGFLDALGVPPHQIPEGIDAQAGLYRSLLAERQMLIVLDNARDVEQVRPLLPGSAGSMVVVTSRNRLAGLAVTDGAHLLTLDVLSVEDARDVLRLRLGARRVAAEPVAAEDIVRLCGRLPLALAIVAARAVARPHFPLAATAAELREAQGSLDAFSDDDSYMNVRAIFSWSYQTLSPPAARLFRLLGLHWGPDISLPATTSLIGSPSKRAVRSWLGELTRSRLLTEHRPGRYTFHDLIRAYAGELSEELDPAQDRAAAVTRLLDHYLHTAHAAHMLMQPHRRFSLRTPPSDGVTPEEILIYVEAMRWFTVERDVLSAAVRYATEHGFGAHAWQLALTLPGFYQRTGFWHDWATTMRFALQAAEDTDDRPGQAQVHRSLAGAYHLLDHNDLAIAHLERTQELFTQLGYKTEHAYVHSNFGRVLGHQGEHEKAIEHHQEALRLYQAADHRKGQAISMEGIGWCENRAGRPEQALVSTQQAMRLYEELGDLNGQGNCWGVLAESHRLLGNYEEAVRFRLRSIELYRSLGSRADEMDGLVALGDTQAAAGNVKAARAAWNEALTMLNGLRLPRATEVLRRIRDLDS